MDDPPKAGVTPARVRKKPPPEKPEAISLRTKVVVSFWAVILLLGLPTWYKTTSIYRARLPLQEMLDWADGSVGLPTVSLPVWIHAPGFECLEAQRLVQETQAALDNLTEFSIFHQRLRLVHNDDPSLGRKQNQYRCGENTKKLDAETAAAEVLLENTSQGAQFQLREPSSHSVISSSTGPRSSLPTDLAKAVRSLFYSEQIATALRINAQIPNNDNAGNFLRSQSQDAVNEIHKQLSRAIKSSPSYHLTFSLFTAGGAPSSWDIHDVLATYIHPLVHALGNTSDIEVATQVQLYSSFSPSIQTFQIEERDGNFIKQNDLTAFVNAAEWPLSPSIGTGPTLNFIVFIPPLQQVPLNIEGHEGTSWLVPQWGGITILNPPLVPHPINGVLTIPGHLSRDLVSAAFETFATQLLSLMGVISIDFQGKSMPLALCLQAHQRISGLTLHMKAASSLGALARLAQRLGSIPIPKRVAQLVENAMGNLTASTQAFGESRWNDAVAYASAAYQDSEKAFFDKSMVGQVYFPDEHKIAVYLPLLGPVGVPLLVGLIREIKRLITSFKTSKT